jgi:hypothetical protein
VAIPFSLLNAKKYIILLLFDVLRISEKAFFLVVPQASLACSWVISNLHVEMSIERRWNDTDQEKIAELGQKPVPVSVRPPQIPPELVWSPYRPVAERRSLGK